MEDAFLVGAYLVVAYLFPSYPLACLEGAYLGEASPLEVHLFQALVH